MAEFRGNDESMFNQKPFDAGNDTAFSVDNSQICSKKGRSWNNVENDRRPSRISLHCRFHSGGGEWKTSRLILFLFLLFSFLFSLLFLVVVVVVVVVAAAAAAADCVDSERFPMWGIHLQSQRDFYSR